MPKPRPTPPRPDPVAAAVEVFVRGFGFTRSFTHPYLGERIGPLWVLRDAPRKKAADYRTEEWVAMESSPAETVGLVRTHTRGHHAICVILPTGHDDGPVRTAYKALGYRLFGTEPLMVHDLKKIPRPGSPAVIRRVLTTDLADQVTKAARSRQILPEQLRTDAPLRQYAALVDGRVVGWVRSIADPAGTWCSNMFVQPKHRRQGIASALLAQMLRDDRAYGSARAVLLTSHTGAKLYVTLGYLQIGTLFLFRPTKKTLAARA
jgi:GNAT superfamily N-acetyltransferase